MSKISCLSQNKFCFADLAILSLRYESVWVCVEGVGWGGMGVNGNRKLYLGLDSTLFSIVQFYQRIQHWEVIWVVRDE